MTDFEKFLLTIGDNDEVRHLTMFTKGDKEKEQKIIDFIKENNIDCTHLWEDGDEGDRSTENWHKLFEFAIKL